MDHIQILTIGQKTNNKRFQYGVIVTLHHKEIERNCQGYKQLSLLEINITRKE